MVFYLCVYVAQTVVQMGPTQVWTRRLMGKESIAGSTVGFSLVQKIGGGATPRFFKRDGDVLSP